MATTVSAAPFALPTSPSAPELLAKYFRVLGNPTRLRALELLAEHGELSVGALVNHLGESQPMVSNHLACLRWCGFVSSRREHPAVLYRIADARVLDLVRIGRAVLADNGEHVAACGRVDAKSC